MLLDCRRRIPRNGLDAPRGTSDIPGSILASRSPAAVSRNVWPHSVSA